MSSAPVISRPAIAAAAPALDQVSVVIVTYNGYELIEPCLASVARAGVPLSAVIVVDNASADDTCEVIRSAFPQVRIIASDQNVGYGAAVNLGVRMTTSSYVLVLNQDAIVEPGLVEALVAALESDPMVALANAKIVLADDPTRVNACGNTMHYTGITVCRGFGASSSDFVEPEELQVISGAAFLARRLVFDRLGGFDPRYFLYLEDTDLSLRTALAGYRSVLVPNAVAHHQFVPRFAPEKLFWLERNRHMMLATNFEWRTLAALAPALALTDLIVLGYALLHGRRALTAKLRAYGWLIANWSTILRERRRIRRHARESDRSFFDRCARELDLAEISHPLARAAMGVVNPIFQAWYPIARRVLAE